MHGFKIQKSWCPMYLQKEIFSSLPVMTAYYCNRIMLVKLVPIVERW